MTTFPSSSSSTRALILQKSSSQEKPVYHDTILTSHRIPDLKQDEILVRMTAVAFNRRDLWIRLGQYPGITFGSVLGSDGVGIVMGSFDPNDHLLHKRVFLVPMRGWKSAPDAPETDAGFGILGGGSRPALGTFSEYIVVERDQVIVAPDHLDDVHLAAWPLGGVTAWRATMINGEISASQNVLITGAGGGVAILAIQLCIVKGANVYVTSGSEEKIQMAIKLGAKGGVNYKSTEWPTELANLLNQNTNGTGKIDAVIDSGGGDQLMTQIGRILKSGGRVVCYGMTAGRQISMTMREVMKNQRLIGSTMGSHADLISATKFLAKHRIVPVVAYVIDGLENAEEGFELMQKGNGFGKIVIKIREHGQKANF